MFVGDTTATCHSSFSDLGMSNLEDSRNKTGIKAANGGLIKPVKIGDVTGLACSADGQDQGIVTLQRARQITTNAFNLFLLIKIIKKVGN